MSGSHLKLIRSVAAKVIENMEDDPAVSLEIKLSAVGVILQGIAAGHNPEEVLSGESIIPVNLIPVPDFGLNKQLCVNPVKKRYYVRVGIPPNSPPLKIMNCYKHDPPCGKKLKRPHSICAHCLYVKRSRGEIGEYVPVDLIVWARRLGAPYERQRAWLTKKLQEALEYVSDR